jgi:LuxR family maltose regulon positive regulatory protein
MPLRRQQLLERSHLVERLHGGVDGKLTLISAPGGFGKTSLACQWLETCGMPVAWYSIDEGDAEQGLFFKYLVASLAATGDQLREALDPLMEAGNELPGMEVIGQIIIALQQQRDRLVLALDDYQMVDTAEVHEVIAFLLRHLPPSLHLVIISRQEPPFPLARFRAMGEVNEIHAHSLRFTREESSVIVKGLADDPLDAWQELEVYERTEGWPIGVQMAGLSLREQSGETAHDSQFPTGKGMTLDYLLEEMLQTQPPEVTDFLLVTSTLPRFCADLCNSLLGTEDADAIIRLLEKNGAFIIPLDENSQWYRYHHLFAEILRARLDDSPFTSSELHKQASRWFAARDQLHEAFHHAFASMDMEFATAMLGERWMDLLGSYDFSSARHWLDRVPEAVFEQDIMLRLFRLSIMLSQEELDSFEEQMAALQADLAQGPDRLSPQIHNYVQSLLGPAKAIFLHLNDQAEDALQVSQHSLAGLPPNSSLARCLALIALAYAYAEKGEPLLALPRAQEAIVLSQRLNQAHLLMLMIALKAELQFSCGKLCDAERFLVESFSELVRSGFVKSSTGIHMMAQMAAIHYRRNEFARALEQTRKCILYAKPQQANQSLLEAYRVEALILQAQGKSRQATDMISEARSIAAATAAPLRQRSIDLTAIELALLQGEMETVAAWADSQDICADQSYSPQWERSAILLAKYRLATREYAQARDLIEILKPRAEKRSRFDACLAADLVKTSALQGLGVGDQARTILEHAVECAAPEGYIRPFVEHAEQIYDLLMSLRSSAIESVRSYLPRILQACQHEMEPSARARRIELAHGVELTPREAEVLQFIAAGMSNKEIAATAFVSLSTVKTHINHIFQKLDVGNRKQMIEKASELQII